MEKNMKHIDNLFKDELGAYIETPPPPVWDSLEKRLNERRKRKFPYGFWYISILACVALLGASILWKMGNDHHTNASIAAPINNNTPQKPATTNLATVTATKTLAANTTKTDRKHNKQHNDQKTTSAVTANNTNKQATHIANQKKAHEKIKTTQNKKKTDDDLYADVDDDQYTVGYSSNARKNNGPSADDNSSDYEMHQTNQDNIGVAQMEPRQNVRETNYASRPSMTKEETDFKIRNEKIAAKVNNTPAESADRSLAANTPHKHKTDGAHPSISHNTAVNKPATHDALATTASAGRKHKKAIAKAAPVNVVAATDPVVKTITAKKLAALDPTKEKENKIVKNSTTQPTQKETIADKTTAPKVANNSIAAAANTSKDIALTKPAPKTHAAANTNTGSKVAKDDHQASENKVALIAKKNGAQIPAAQSPKAKTSGNANTPIAATTTKAGKTPKHNEQMAKAIPATNNYASAASMKDNNHTQTAHKSKSQHTAQKNTPTIAAKTPITKNKPSEDRQPAIKTDNQKTTAAVITPASDIAKDKQASVSRNASKTVATTAQKQTGKTTAKKDKQGMAEKATAEHKAIARNENKHDKKEAGKNATGNTLSNNKTVAPSPANVYSANFSKPTFQQDAATIDNLQVNNFVPQQPLTPNTSTTIVPGTFKPEETKPADSLAKTEMVDSTKKHHLLSSRFEAGIKGGYETGFNRNAANKFVVSPYLQFNLTDKFALMTQPAVKVSYINSEVGSPHSYYDTLKSTGPNPLGSPVAVIVVNGPSSSTVGSIQEYTYSEQYKSIVKSYNYGGNYYEFEIPFLLKYKILRQLSVYGGANIIYSKYVSIKENTSTSGILTKFDTANVFTPLGHSASQPQSINKAISYAGLPYANYTSPLYPSQNGDLLRLGYMLGFNYEYKKRWQFDVLIQQAMVKSNNENGYNTNEPLAMPYFRFTIGYKLTK